MIATTPATARRRRPWAAFAFLSCVLLAGDGATEKNGVEAFATLSISAKPSAAVQQQARRTLTCPRAVRAAARHDVGVDEHKASSSEPRSAEQRSTRGAPQQQQQQQQTGTAVAAKRRSLYDILRASPDATREELKTQYVALARETHPDALRGKNPTDPALDDPNDRPDFNDVATAWKLLSDPLLRKKYDRTLRAERFTKDVGNLAAHVAGTTVPRVRRMFDDFAASPLVRKTRATAAAGFEAAANDAAANQHAKKDGEAAVDLGHAIFSAVRASQKAGRDIDRRDLADKSAELAGRAEEEADRAASLRMELASIVEERLRIALRTPHSDLSSMEALTILDGFNTIDSVSVVESIVLLKKTLQAEIGGLEEAERQYYEKYDTEVTAERAYAMQRESLRQATKNAESAAAAERRAREALRAAQELRELSKRTVLERVEAVEAAENVVGGTSTEVDATRRLLQKRQERVRKALRKKEEVVRLVTERGDGNSGMPWRFGKNLEPFQERAVVFQQHQQQVPFMQSHDAPFVSGYANDGSGDDDKGAARYFDEVQELAAAVADLGEEDDDVAVVDKDDEEQIKVNLERLEELRKTERMLTGESTRLESRALRLQSRARKLKDRADGMMTGDDIDSPPLSTRGLYP